MSTDTHRLQNTTTINERTVPLTLHVKTIVKDRIRQIVESEKLKNPDDEISMSSVGGSYLERGLREHMDMQYGALLEPILKKILQREMRAIKQQFRWLLVRIAFDANQTRTLVTNIFSRQPGVTSKVRERVLVETAKSAKKNIFGKSPQMNELVDIADTQFSELSGYQSA